MKQTRLKLTFIFGFIAAALTGFAIHEGLDAVATIGMGVIGGIVAKYNHDETQRPSIK